MNPRTLLVTGASRGIGKAIALRLARDGFDLVVHCRSRREQAEEVATLARELGREARVLCFDVADRAACAAALSNSNNSSLVTATTAACFTAVGTRSTFTIQLEVLFKFDNLTRTQFHVRIIYIGLLVGLYSLASTCG